MGAERRNYVRFLAQDTAFAALRVGFRKVGRVNDISIGGMGFSYLSENGEANLDFQNSQVDIFLSGNGLHIPNIPCKIVYDIQTSEKEKGLLINMRRCGLHFGELIESQLERLNFFIKNHTKGVLKV